MNKPEPNHKRPFDKAIRWGNTALSALIKNLLAALGLASLFEKTIDWSPLIQKAIEIYQKVIYPIWDFLLGWMGYNIPGSVKDILTLNVLLIVAISSSKALDNVQAISIFRTVFNELKKVVSSFYNAYLDRAKVKVSALISRILRAMLQFIFNFTMSLIFICLGSFVYLLIIWILFRKIRSAENATTRSELVGKLKSLFNATLAILYGFIALLGLNYALFGI